MKIRDVVAVIERLAPLSYQEGYDNCGLNVGSHDAEATGALLTVDVTEAVIDEAVERGMNLIVSHHPVIFDPIKRIAGGSYVEKIVARAIRNDINLYAAHTNLDSVAGGINRRMAQMLGLVRVTPLSPVEGDLFKVVVFTPLEHVSMVRAAMFDAGAGSIGDYDSCSYNLHGEGTFRALPGARPFVGRVGELHTEPEVRTEAVVPGHRVSAVVEALRRAHPYEEPACDVYPLENRNPAVGMGAVGELEQEEDLMVFLARVKKTFGSKVIRHSPAVKKNVRRVALCGGSGGSLLKSALASGADLYVTADLKYNHFFDAGPRMVVADAGHFETEYCAVDILYELVTEKITNFAVAKSKILSNPVNYLF